MAQRAARRAGAALCARAGENAHLRIASAQTLACATAMPSKRKYREILAAYRGMAWLAPAANSGAIEPLASEACGWPRPSARKLAGVAGSVAVSAQLAAGIRLVAIWRNGLIIWLWLASRGAMAGCGMCGAALSG